MKKALTIICTIILLASCTNTLMPPAARPSPDGMGTVQIILGDGAMSGGSARTLLPTTLNISTMYFVLTFTLNGSTENTTKTLSQMSNITMQLPEGNWHLDVNGFLSEADMADPALAYVNGAKDFSVSTTGSNTVNVELSLVNTTLSHNGSGTLSYNITIPQDAVGTFAIYSDLEEKTLVKSVSFTATAYNQDTLQLNSGFYYINVIANYNGFEKTWQEIAHIYDAAITEAVHEFTADDFTNSGNAAITSFSLSLNNEYVNINNDTNAITVFGTTDTSLVGLKPIISYTGAMISPAPDVQMDFTGPVNYTVYTENGATKTYTVTVMDSFSDLALLADYLATFPQNTADNPVSIAVKVNLTNQWTVLLDILNSAGLYVDLSIAQCTGMTDFATGAGYAGKNMIVSLTLPSATTSIPPGTQSSPTFGYFTSLKSISGPGITNIGDYAFNDCTSLGSIDFPVLVTFGNFAFRNCTGLSSVTMANSVNSIQATTFNLCTSLANINVNNGNSKYSSQDGLLYNKNPLTLFLCPEGKAGAVDIPAGITAIGNSAFSGCVKITSVTIPASVTNIGSSIFSGIANLTVTVNTNSITSWTSAFADTTGLAVILGTGITTVGSSAFSGCTALASVNLGNISSIDDSAFSGCTNLRSVTIPDSINRIGDSAFSNCAALTSMVIPANVTYIGNSVFSGTTNVTVTVNTNSITSWTSAFAGTTGLAVILGNSITSIESSAFSGCTGLAKITIPGSIITIGSNAFLNCTSLAGVVVPDSVISIGSSAFSGCGKLTSVTLSKSLTGIEDTVFKSCSVLSSIAIPASIKTIGNAAFSGCAALTSMSLPEGLTSISDNAFENCTRLSTSNIPSSVTVIGNAIYSGSANLTVTINTNSIKNWIPVFTNAKSFKVIFGNSVTSIGNSAFAGCTGLAGVTIPGSIPTVDNSAFAGCTALASVTIQSGVTTIGNTSFNSCTALASIVLPATVTRIEYYAFDKCTKLASVTINGIIGPDDFSPVNAFVGDLRAKYLGTIGGPGLYTANTLVSGQFLWSKN